jgi:aldehyde dehydrogenase (NAD+)
MIANRLVVDLAVYDEFVSAFTDRARDLRAGDPADPATDIGPVLNSKQLSSIRDKVERAVSAGARQVLGGEPSGPAGLLLPPHVLRGETGVATAKEEVFGPVITIIPAAGEQDALRIANDTEYGLSSAVFTRDAERGAAFALSVQAGMTHVNDSPVNDDTNTAFGGVKASGGVRGLDTAARMLALGVARFGINTGAAIELVQACQALPAGRLPIPDRDAALEGTAPGA